MALLWKTNQLANSLDFSPLPDNRSLRTNAHSETLELGRTFDVPRCDQHARSPCPYARLLVLQKPRSGQLRRCVRPGPASQGNDGSEEDENELTRGLRGHRRDPDLLLLCSRVCVSPFHSSPPACAIRQACTDSTSRLQWPCRPSSTSNARTIARRGRCTPKRGSRPVPSRR